MPIFGANIFFAGETHFSSESIVSVHFPILASWRGVAAVGNGAKVYDGDAMRIFTMYRAICQVRVPSISDTPPPPSSPHLHSAYMP